MNKKQKIVVLLGMIIILVMALYPPRKAVLSQGIGGAQSERDWGYSFFRRMYPIPNEADMLSLSFLFSAYQEKSRFYSIVYDYPRLAFQWVLVLILATGFLLLFSDKKNPHN